MSIVGMSRKDMLADDNIKNTIYVNTIGPDQPRNTQSTLNNNEFMDFLDITRFMIKFIEYGVPPIIGFAVSYIALSTLTKLTKNKNLLISALVAIVIFVSIYFGVNH